MLIPLSLPIYFCSRDLTCLTLNENNGEGELS